MKEKEYKDNDGVGSVIYLTEEYLDVFKFIMKDIGAIHVTTDEATTTK